MKYFITEKQGQEQLSTYQKKLEKKVEEEYHSRQDEIDIEIVKYLKQLFGDIKLEEDIIQEFVKFFSRFGGRYSVMSDRETLTDLLQIKQEIPTLSKEAISKLGIYYIKDLFEEYDLKSVLHALVDSKGTSDKTFELFLDYVDEKAEEQQQRYIEAGEEIHQELLSQGYCKQYADYLKELVVRQHYDKEEILSHLPEKELVKKDVDHLIDIATRYRITFGTGTPLSFQLTKEILKDEELSKYPEELSYQVKFDHLKDTIPTTFTKSKFIESTKRKQRIK